MNEFREIRESLGLSQVAIATLLGVTHMTYWKRESGRIEDEAMLRTLRNITQGYETLTALPDITIERSGNEWLASIDIIQFRIGFDALSNYEIFRGNALRSGKILLPPLRPGTWAGIVNRSLR